VTCESVVQEAHRLVHGDRGRDYGPPWEDYARTAAIFAAMTGVELTVDQAILFMVAVKLSRMAVSPGMRDHYVDAAGYLDCLWQTVERATPISSVRPQLSQS
jgi:hypothetical protein